MRHFFYFHKEDEKLADLFVQQGVFQAQFLEKKISVNEEDAIFLEYHTNDEVPQNTVSAARKMLRVYKCIRNEFNCH